MFIPVNPSWLEYILVGSDIMLIALFRPHGILSDEPALTLPKKRIESIVRGVGGAGRSSRDS